MRIIDFFNYMEVSITNANELDQIIVDFLLTNRLLPFTEAIQRQKIPTLNKRIKELLTQYWEALQQDPNVLQHKWLKESLKPTAFYEADSKEILDDTLQAIYRACVHKHSSKSILSEIEQLVIEHGQRILQDEHLRATQCAYRVYQEGRLVCFEEYATFCFYYEKVSSQSSMKLPLTKTLQQFLSYMNFVQRLITPFLSLPYAETSLHAEMFDKHIDKLNGMITDYLQKVETYLEELRAIENKLNTYSAYVMHHGHQEAPPGHLGGPGCFATEKTEGMIASFHYFMEEEKLERAYKEKKDIYDRYLLLFTNSNGEFKKDSPEISQFFEQLHYWTENIPRMYRRMPVLLELQRYQPQLHDKKEGKLYRLISEGEAQSIITHKAFLQSKQSAEREKWFYYGKGAPGVNHALSCCIYFKPGALEFIRSLQQEDGKYAVFAKKPNETDCIGVHEDALPFFNQLVIRVEITSNGAKRNFRPTTVSFPSLNLSDHPLIQHQLPEGKPMQHVTLSVENAENLRQAMNTVPPATYLTKEKIKEYYTFIGKEIKTLQPLWQIDGKHHSISLFNHHLSKKVDALTLQKSNLQLHFKKGNVLDHPALFDEINRIEFFALMLTHFATIIEYLVLSFIQYITTMEHEGLISQLWTEENMVNRITQLIDEKDKVSLDTYMNENIKKYLQFIENHIYIDEHLLRAYYHLNQTDLVVIFEEDVHYMTSQSIGEDYLHQKYILCQRQDNKMQYVDLSLIKTENKQDNEFTKRRANSI